MSFKNVLSKLARTSGSYQTRSNRVVIIERFADKLQKSNIQVKEVQHLKATHIQEYARSRRDAGISARTIQNEMAAIRHVLRESGCTRLADGDKISNKSLGISNASRDGTKVAMPQSVFNSIVEKVAVMDKGVEACMYLQLHLGLRGEEAVQGDKSLRSWERALQKGDTVKVIYGTKGGRHRVTTVPDREKALQAVQRALGVAKSQGDRIVDKPNLKEAMARHKYIMASCGCVGIHAPHSLRYAFVNNSFNAYQEQDYSRKDALAMASMDIGHGDGRGRYIQQVYGRT